MGSLGCALQQENVDSCKRRAQEGSALAKNDVQVAILSAVQTK
jgi:hypothetical protein